MFTSVPCCLCYRIVSIFIGKTKAVRESCSKNYFLCMKTKLVLAFNVGRFVLVRTRGELKRIEYFLKLCCRQQAASCDNFTVEPFENNQNCDCQNNLSFKKAMLHTCFL